MRLRRLDLTRYGKFTDGSIDFGERTVGVPDLHVVYGLNEAGKSTALSAILDLLFGIEERTRYGFLHPNNALEIGACIEISGTSHEFVRRKQRTGSLLDKQGRAASEALLSGALSGLGREAFRMMFSLDDETLEEGGNAILQSRGDLGELLFAANAGLAHIGACLAETAETANGLYKKRARSTVIAQHKLRLTELKSEREALDTAASTFAALAQTATKARAAYEEAMTERARMRSSLDDTRRLVKAIPEADQYRAIETDLKTFDDLPRPPDGWMRELPALMEAETRTATLIESVRERSAALAGEIDDLVPDAPVLELGDEIRRLSEAVGRFTTAEEDLPRRRIALVEFEAKLAATLEALGQQGHAEPAALLLPAPLLGTLQELIGSRSGVEAGRRAAEREVAEAAEAVEVLTRETEGMPAVSTSGEAALASLEAVLRRVRASEAPLRLRLARETLPAARRRFDEAMSALGSSFADIAALSALDLPDTKRMEAWRRGIADLERRRTAHREKRDAFEDEAARASARREALRGAAGPIDDDEARRLRTARDAAWAAHGSTLDATSAAIFADALAADDRIVDARFLRMRDLEELRQLASLEAAARAGLAAEMRHLGDLETEAGALQAEIGAAVPAALATEERAELRLDRIEAFGRRRGEVLQAAAAFAEAEEAAASASEDAERDRSALAETYRHANPAPPDGAREVGLLDLAEQTEALIARSKAKRAEAEAAAKRLAERTSALARRRRELQAAEEAVKRWQGAWAQALDGCWIDAALPVGAVRELLEALTALSPVLARRDDLLRRVETMTEDQSAFVRRLDALLAGLGEKLGDDEPREAFARLVARLAEAERQSQTRQEKRREFDLEARKIAALEDERAVAAARKAEMTTFFGVDGLTEVALRLDEAAERSRRERRLAEIGVSLAAELRMPSPDDAMALVATIDRADVDRQAAELEARHDDLDGRSRALFAEATKAADALAAVGGDDAVARLQVERQTVLIEVEEAAQRYLRLRAGALVAEEALRAYRDRHRSTMMSRASHAFAAMTRGDYTGLSALAEKDRETLIGLPRDGGSKLATAMSKGTRFQLYLALRLAGYEEFAAARRPVPFLADDIMETFDEPRSEEVLRLLASMARIGQVVYFTHHRHLCDLAKTVEPTVRIHHL